MRKIVRYSSTMTGDWMVRGIIWSNWGGDILVNGLYKTWDCGEGWWFLLERVAKLAKVVRFYSALTVHSIDRSMIWSSSRQINLRRRHPRLKGPYLGNIS